MQCNSIYIVFKTGKTKIFFLEIHKQELKPIKNKKLIQNNDYTKGRE